MSKAKHKNEFSPEVADELVDQPNVAPVDSVDVVTSFQVYSGPAPEGPARKRGGSRKSKFPFDTMEVGDWFPIAATSAKPEPWRSYQSAVSAAQAKYAKQDGERDGKKGGEIVKVPKMVPTRRFQIYRTSMNDSEVAVIKRIA